MKQVIQSAGTRQFDLEDVPRPSAAPGEPLVAAVAADRARISGLWIRLQRMAP